MIVQGPHNQAVDTFLKKNCSNHVSDSASCSALPQVIGSFQWASVHELPSAVHGRVEALRWDQCPGGDGGKGDGEVCLPLTPCPPGHGSWLCFC